MTYGDLTNPAVTDFADRVTSLGYTKLGQPDVSRLNDFVSYLHFICPHGNFAYYPLASTSNVGNGQLTGMGIGNLARHTNLVFNGTPLWTTSGARFTALANCAFIDMSGDGSTKPNFKFRRDPATIFYIFRHERGDNEQTLFRAGVRCPYFWCDDSVDNFGVLAPEFSTDNRRPPGTTYIYDEIYGIDKKGMSVDWSAPSTEHSGIPYQFHSLGNENDNNYLSLFSTYNSYELSSKVATLNGNFIESYNYSDYRYDYLPARLAIGGGCSNLAAKTDVGGVPHLCFSVLVLSGDYSKTSNESLHNYIINKMMEASNIT